MKIQQRIVQICVGLFLLLAAATAFAQIDTTSLTGQTTDLNGAAVSGARVIVTNQATNVATDVTTNTEGYYTISSLRPNLYTIAVEQTGFRRETRTDARH